MDEGEIIIDEMPLFDPRLQCANCGDKTVIIEGYGIIGGGGIGKYTFCDTCGHVITKTCDSHEETGHATGDQG
jgi:hypothetical protein